MHRKLIAGGLLLAVVAAGAGGFFLAGERQSRVPVIQIESYAKAGFESFATELEARHHVRLRYDVLPDTALMSIRGKQADVDAAKAEIKTWSAACTGRRQQEDHSVEGGFCDLPVQQESIVFHEE